MPSSAPTGTARRRCRSCHTSTRREIPFTSFPHWLLFRPVHPSYLPPSGTTLSNLFFRRPPPVRDRPVQLQPTTHSQLGSAGISALRAATITALHVAPQKTSRVSGHSRRSTCTLPLPPRFANPARRQSGVVHACRLVVVTGATTSSSSCGSLISKVPPFTTDLSFSITSYKSPRTRPSGYRYTVRRPLRSKHTPTAPHTGIVIPDAVGPTVGLLPRALPLANTQCAGPPPRTPP